MGITAQGKKNAGLLTEGSIAKGILSFAIPLFLGQLLQQFYNVADAWVVGNFADNDSFAAVSSAGSLTFLIIGFFNGIAIGGGVVISKYFGARDEKTGAVGSVLNLFDDYKFNHKPEYEKGILEQECSEILKRFFKDLRKSKKDK